MALPQVAADVNEPAANDVPTAGVNQHSSDLKEQVDMNEIFNEKDLIMLYESAPNSVQCVSPKNLPSIQPPQSAPQLTNTNNDLMSLEDILGEEITISNPPTPRTISTKSPYSQISGVELFSSSPSHDFSDSGTSWYPDSEEDRYSKNKRKLFPERDSSESEDDIIITPPKRRQNQRKSPITIPSSDESMSILDTHFNQGTSADPASTDLQVPSSSSNQNSPAASAMPTTPKRWKKSDPSKWKRNIAKQNRNAGLPYLSKSGKFMNAKQPKPVKCDIKCRFQCTQNFSDDDRKFLCEHYWQIKDYASKKQFLLYHVIPTAIKRMATNTRDNKHRKVSNAYYFTKNEEKLRVCKDFFLKTLCISNGPVNQALKNRNEFGHFVGKDKRGSQEPVNKTSPEVEQRIIQHINSFPRLESHYCRKKSRRQYLDSNLTLAKMYELYKDQLKSTGEIPASLFVYKQIFGTKFNLSFFRPKKDLCMTCTRFNNGGQPIDLKEEYEEHIIRKKSAQEAKAVDKQRSIEDPSYLVVTVDMQSTLQIPVSGIGILYYSRKLNVQNFTIHTAKPPNEAYCIVWNEINGKRGSVEIATALNWWFSKIPSTIKEVTIYSDTCAGQNRNQYITAFLIHYIQKTGVELEIIEQKFLESGHTHMEVDSMHSAIEKEARHTPVYSMIDWKSIMHRARSTRHRESAPPYIVHELTYDDMIDVRAITEYFVKNINKDTEGNKVMWLKIKCLRVEKENPGIVKFRYCHDGPYSTFDMFQTSEKSVPRTTRKRKRGQENENDREIDREDLIKKIKSYEIPKVYEGPLPISEAKKKDLMNLCAKGVIPRELHPWYQSLATRKDIVDRLCEPDLTERDEEQID